MTETREIKAQPDRPAPERDLTPANLWGSHQATEIVARATATAKALAGVLEDRELYVSMGTDKQGRERRHVVVEGWTMLGTMLGVTPICEWSRPMEDGAWEARVEARTLDGRVVGAAEAMCSPEEDRWDDAEQYAIRSMAQTRATGKALRVPLGFVVSLAGFDTTPAEEMPAGGRGRKAKLATEGQVNYLVRLAEKHEHTPAEMARYIERHYGVERATSMNRQDASALIDRMNEGPLEIPEAGEGDPEPDPEEEADAAVNLSKGIKRIAEREWSPSEQDAADSEDPEGERAFLLRQIADLVADQGWTQEHVRAIVGGDKRKKLGTVLEEADLAELNRVTDQLQEAATDEDEEGDE